MENWGLKDRLHELENTIEDYKDTIQKYEFLIENLKQIIFRLTNENKELKEKLKIDL